MLQSKLVFPDLSGIEPTRKTLHLYAAALGAVARLHAIRHPKWWHISLKVRPEGLVTDAIALPDGSSFAMRMDLLKHCIVLQTSQGSQRLFDMREGLTGTEFGDLVLDAVAGLGLEGDYAREKFEDDSPRQYDPDAAGRLFTAFVCIDGLFKKHRASLPGEVSPVQIWPYGFDLALDWFGTRPAEYEEHGQIIRSSARLNLGFFPGGPEPYFYSNPSPFERDLLLGQPLPSGARWYTDDWEGTYLPYASLAGREDAAERLLEYASQVFKIASPTLM
jgi:hypothetical protein